MARIFTAFTQNAGEGFKGVGEALADFSKFKLQQQKIQQDAQNARRQLELGEERLGVMKDQLKQQERMAIATRRQAMQLQRMRNESAERMNQARIESTEGLAAADRQSKRSIALQSIGERRESGRAALRQRKEEAQLRAETAIQVAEIGAQGKSATAQSKAEQEAIDFAGEREAAIATHGQRRAGITLGNNALPEGARLPQSRLDEFNLAFDGIEALIEAAGSQAELDRVLADRAGLYRSVEDALKDARESYAAQQTQASITDAAQSAASAGVDQARIDAVLGNGSLNAEERLTNLQLLESGSMALQSASKEYTTVKYSGTADGAMLMSLERSAADDLSTYLESKRGAASVMRDMDSELERRYDNPESPRFQEAMRRSLFFEPYRVYRDPESSPIERAGALRQMLGIARMDDATSVVVGQTVANSSRVKEQQRNSELSRQYETAAYQVLPPNVQVELGSPTVQLAVEYIREYGDFWAAGIGDPAQGGTGFVVDGWDDYRTEHATVLAESLLGDPGGTEMAPTGPGRGYITEFDRQARAMHDAGVTPEQFAYLSQTVYSLLAEQPPHFKAWYNQVTDLPK